jgi:hypothetical protein
MGVGGWVKERVQGRVWGGGHGLEVEVRRWMSGGGCPEVGNEGTGVGSEGVAVG